MALKGLLVLFAGVACQASDVALRQEPQVPEIVCEKALQVAKLCQAKDQALEQQPAMPQVILQKAFQVVPQEAVFYLSWGGLFVLCYGLWRLFLDLKGFLQFLSDIKGLAQKARQLFAGKVKVDNLQEDRFKDVFVQGPCRYIPIGSDTIGLKNYHAEYKPYKRDGDWGAVWI